MMVCVVGDVVGVVGVQSRKGGMSQWYGLLL